MSVLEKVEQILQELPPGAKKYLDYAFERLPIEKGLNALPFFRSFLERQTDSIMDQIAVEKPYAKKPKFRCIPKKGVAKRELVKTMSEIAEQEKDLWQKGYVSGAVYHGAEDHIRLMNRVYDLHSQANALHSDLWPSIAKYESEIVAMTAQMLGKTARKSHQEICGCISSGGTESILLAMKAYRDWAYKTKRIKRPELIVPETAHAAFDKACEYFHIKKVSIPIGSDYRAQIKAARSAITRNTIAMVGSAPSFPHGVIDPIQEMSDIALRKDIGFHVDACLGGFVLPWLKDKHQIPQFDFSLPGVTSISVDTHKYGFSNKGTSVILYRNHSLRHFQYFTTSEWPGGLYFSPTFAGSRSGALSAQCWAAMVSTGEEGYRAAAEKIVKTAAVIKSGIEEIPELEVMGDPLWVIAFRSPSLNIYSILEQMTKRHWNLNGLHKPSCIHICVTLPHTKPGVAKRFLADLRASVRAVKRNPNQKEGMAPVYGMAATLPAGGVVRDLLKRYLDTTYEVG